YMSVEEEFIKDLFFGFDTKLGRALVQEPVLITEKTNHILDYERATHIIEEADYIGVGTCYCRHKNLHLGKPCKINAPLEVCLSFDNIAHSLAHHGGYARLISKEEAKDILTTAYESNLVQMVENVREHPAFMCNCCGCCCEALGAAKKFGPMQPIATSSYMPSVSEGCVGCCICAKVCPVEAISMEDGKPVIDETICLGCGICARNCHKKSIILNRRPVEIITPVNSTHRYVVQAIEKGTLQNLIFDNQAFASHRAMAAVLGVILKLPPLKQAMASKQFKSIYLDRLLSNQKKREQ
ncbi:MAG: (Fe-S)-binding protein, partial [Clostridiales bacterium]|nr:(Fe-S)-binding protein [Candidatus Crickella merdequi]